MATLLGVFVTLGLGGAADACPNCAVGQKARAEVWSQGFGANLFAAALPFLVVGAVCARLEGGVRTRPRGYDPEDELEALEGVSALERESIVGARGGGACGASLGSVGGAR